ncbi:hypothetical protein H8S95_12745 [Pontibacter sp. KCTC 32443]|uniref:hypothetical protein n=1 Tax=Pontibacter TaxID=323449 RepID=UPI00164E5192|nr:MULTISPECIES: hypothetical protein [Pontibacter]MBC5774937.1 hypothetical protein [Pontibacter sp. KCTC 32443]
MQEIQQLLKVLQKISSKNLLNSYLQKGKSLEGCYVNGITQGEFNSDVEAAYKLYGTDQSDVRYKMLKHRVKKKLYNTLLTIDINNTNVAFYKETECSRLLNIAKILLKQTEYHLSIGICNKVIPIAVQYEFNDILLNAYEIELTALTNQGSLKSFNEKRKRYLDQLQLVGLEKEAIGLHQMSKAHLKSTVKVRKSLLNELPSTILRLKNIVSEINTFDSFLSLYKTSILYYELIGDFVQIMNITKDAFERVQQGEINPARFDIKYNAYTLIYAHLRTKEYAKGLIYANDFYSLFDSTTKNWFAYMENYFLLAVHARQYELATVLLHRVRTNTSFTTISNDATERWQLYTAYLYFLEPKSPVLEGFNYQNFVTSVNEYSKDKQGFNVAILILQFMYFLKKGDTEGLLYRIESLKKYILTHLKDTFSLRSKLFLKLLMLTVTEDYDAASCRIKGAKHYQKLIETPTPGDAYAEIEIVPYEHLWELILESMPK